MYLEIYRELQKEGISYDQPTFDMWREEHKLTSALGGRQLGLKAIADIHTEVCGLVINY